jgi:ATP-dependent Clp protease protease subunit
MAERSGQTLEQIHRDCDRDNYMSAEQARDYGLIDQVLELRPG